MAFISTKQEKWWKRYSRIPRHLEVGNERPCVPLEVEGGEDELVEGTAALVDQVEQLPVVRPRLQVAGEQTERRVLAYHHYCHCFQQVTKKRRLLRTLCFAKLLRPSLIPRLTWSISILSWRSSPSPTTSAVLAPSLLTTRILTPGVGAVFVTTLVPVGWNGTLKWLMVNIQVSTQIH